MTAILGNITYTGDSLWQKTFRDADYKQEKNDGQLNRYYLPDHHEALVSREVFVLANQAMGYGDPYASLGIVPPSLLEDAPEEQRSVTVIKAKPRVEMLGSKGKLRVAAYCRVSTDLEDQEGSYEAQCSHYRTLIQSKSDWSLACIYADEERSYPALFGCQNNERSSFIVGEVYATWTVRMFQLCVPAVYVIFPNHCLLRLSRIRSLNSE